MTGFIGDYYVQSLLGNGTYFENNGRLIKISSPDKGKMFRNRIKPLQNSMKIFSIGSS